MKADLKFSPVVQAILALVILLVCVAIFILLARGPLADFLGIEKDVTDDSGDAWANVQIITGQCSPEEEKCFFNKWYTCNNNKWEATDKACDS